MASEPTTCGDDCGASVFRTRVKPGVGWYSSWTVRAARVCFLSWDSVDGPFDGRDVFCPLCGRPLSFAPDGTPTVGPSYAELELDASRLDKLDEYTAFGNGISKIDSEHFGLKSWHPKVPLDFGLDREQRMRLRKSRNAARELADLLPAWDTFEADALPAAPDPDQHTEEE